MKKAHSLVYFLEDLSRLSEISIDELNSWIAKKPYCQNLRMLKAKKLFGNAKMDNEQIISEASFYSIDRARLYHYLHDLSLAKPIEPSLAASESLPEADNTEVEKKAVKSTTKTAEKDQLEKIDPPEPIVSSADNNLSLDQLTVTDAVILDGDVVLKKKKKKLKKSDKLKTTDKIKKNKKKKKRKKKDKIELVPLTKKEAKKKKKGKKKKKNKSKKNLKSQDELHYSIEEDLPLVESPDMSFTEWLMHIRTSGGKFDIPYQDFSNKNLVISSSKARKKAKKSSKANRLAQKSVAVDDEIISSELADLLALQGKKKKAKKMYEKLSLKFPEKSSFFAAKIDKLD